MIGPVSAGSRARRYALLATVVAVAGALVLVPLDLAVGFTWFWCLLGWALMVAVGVAGGARLAGEHGNSGSGFLVVLVACILLRLLGVGVGGVVAAMQEGRALGSYLAGAMVGFVTLQLFEAFWFYRMGRAGIKPGALG